MALWGIVMPPFAYGQSVLVQVHSITGYGEHEAFARSAAAAFERAINSPEFKKRVLNADFIHADGLTNLQVYERIMRAHEEDGDGGQDSVVDLRLRVLEVDGKDAKWKDNCEGNTIGVDGGSSGVAAICPNKLADWVKENSSGALAGHFMHEYMHILGFDHYNKLRGKAWREKTAVYKIGYIIRDLVNEELDRGR